MPGSKSLSFLADDGIQQSNGSCDEIFEIGPWLSPYSGRISIRGNLSAEGLISRDLPPLKSSDKFIPSETILEKEYISAVRQIIENCRLRNGKTVYSRVIAGCNPTLDIPMAAIQLFDIFPDTFGFLYHTPQTGCWLGATPETLLSYDSRSRIARTMAYAGTRQFAGDIPWDAKNIEENLFVADHIVSRFEDAGITADVSAPYSSPYGNLQHLRRDITAKLPTDTDFSRLLDAINPTPALCGTPTDDAIADISRFERHDRRCYGGFIAIHHPNKSFHSFVNLRSARLSLDGSGRFEIIVGGGIISSSNPASEWAETEAKASRLLSILSSPCR